MKVKDIYLHAYGSHFQMFTGLVKRFRLPLHYKEKCSSFVFNNSLIFRRNYIQASFKSATTEMYVGIFYFYTFRPLEERQEGLIVTGIPEGLCSEENIQIALKNAGVDVPTSDIMIMRSRLGRETGRALIICQTPPIRDLSTIFKSKINTRLADFFDVELFVEQCERYDKQSEDLRRLALTENFKKVVTITDIPRTYGRREVAEVLKSHCKLTIPYENIVFRFKQGGIQSDMAWVICPTESDANTVLTSIQELAVPKRVHYGGLYGCAFLWATRLSLFVSDGNLDYLLLREDPYKAKYQVCTAGWQSDINKEAFDALMSELKLGSYGAIEHQVSENNKLFFMQCSSMQHAKRSMTALNILKRRWKIHQHEPFIAYPRQVDVRWSDEQVSLDDIIEDDDDLDEPIHY